MLLPYAPNPNYITRMRDGTIKQLNPFSGTEVWTVPGRGNRPLGILPAHPEPIDPADHGSSARSASAAISTRRPRSRA